mmetsp:Transcript_23157/g.38101  ORF Transcript_23157/g.38101 Transcript_23157/m.38101 type:complete len:224 (-) Transcript_23157:164-835(-)|eukprot:CAMPEP_0184645596 /NCGR_PEP_ID=MMETSP0308-20130426/2116_1 /TAXON_ID=38269 /ORGANISM="Gloeochaete witrockiana, Strain SAG 46.84" /LENGTH=223 /DNA_ID=CAMNT_0027074783 /DNA_START=157 /DNA_END=828 /DNA_ORIENTATION=-
MAHRELRSVVSGAPSSNVPMNVSFYSTNYAAPANPSFAQPQYNPPGSSPSPYDPEPPLLDELGINPDHILKKTVTILNPFKPIERSLLEDADMAGPVFFALLLGFFMLLTGKFQFGYIYGLGSLGCIGIFVVINLMSVKGLDLYKTASILGYCLLPMVFLAFISLIVPVRSLIGFILTLLSIGWCTYMAAKMFVTLQDMTEQLLLIAYPIGLFYGCFALITVF